jgi:hypothetical protein
MNLRLLSSVRIRFGYARCALLHTDVFGLGWEFQFLENINALILRQDDIQNTDVKSVCWIAITSA